MKSITIFLEQGEDESLEQYSIECLSTVSGQYFYRCLHEVWQVIAAYDKSSSLTKDQRKLIEELKSKCSKHFVGLVNK